MPRLNLQAYCVIIFSTKFNHLQFSSYFLYQLLSFENTMMAVQFRYKIYCLTYYFQLRFSNEEHWVNKILSIKMNTFYCKQVLCFIMYRISIFRRAFNSLYCPCSHNEKNLILEKFERSQLSIVLNKQTIKILQHGPDHSVIYHLLYGGIPITRNSCVLSSHSSVLGRMWLFSSCSEIWYCSMLLWFFRSCGKTVCQSFLFGPWLHLTDIRYMHSCNSSLIREIQITIQELIPILNRWSCCHCRRQPGHRIVRIVILHLWYISWFTGFFSVRRATVPFTTHT